MPVKIIIFQIFIISKFKFSEFLKDPAQKKFQVTRGTSVLVLSLKIGDNCSRATLMDGKNKMTLEDGRK